MTSLRLVTRGSPLALAQSNAAAARIRALGVDVDLRVVRTSGDRDSSPFAAMSGIGFFTKELEEELLAGKADLAVHSLKDLPTVQPAGLTLAAILEREDPRDVLITRDGVTFAGLPPGAKVGTSSPRRRALLRGARPDLRFVELRGNVDTRLRKLAAGDCDAIVLALAGLRRLGREGAVTHVFERSVLLPAPGQGAVAIETRAGSEAERIVVRLDHAPTRAAVVAERAFLLGLGGGCSVPIGAWGTVRDGALRLEGVLADPATGHSARAAEEGSAGSPEAVGTRLAARIRDEGGAAILAGLLAASALAGKRVLVTATAATSEGLAAALRERGAHVSECPAVEVGEPGDRRPLDAAIGRIETFAAVAVTSRNGARALVGALERAAGGRDRMGLVAAVGAATASELRSAGIEPGCVAEESTGAALGQELAERLATGARLLLVRAEVAHDALPDRLREAGLEVTDVAGYRTFAPGELGARLADLLAGDAPPDVVVFASPSAVRNVLAAAPVTLIEALRKSAIVACIGPTTAAAAAEAGLEVRVRPERPDADAIVEALVRVCSNGGETG